jgi:RHS repeat-associated protein
MSRRALVVALSSVLLSLALSNATAQDHPNVAGGFSADKIYQSLSDIDAVNTFNGDALVHIPIGQPLHVNANLSLGLSLVYNSKVWTFSQQYVGNPYYRDFTEASPKIGSAGLGWILSLGGFEISYTPTTSIAGSKYTSPDGSKHQFYSSLHPGEATTSSVAFTRDDTYLRLRQLTPGSSNSACEIDFPDGSVQRFTSDGVLGPLGYGYRLTQIRDPFGNTVNITYFTDTVTNRPAWKLTDTHNRSQYVYFKKWTSGATTKEIVDQVVLTAFNGSMATYSFTYTDTSVTRGCGDTHPTNSASVTVPMLTSINLPDGSKYVATYYTDNPDNSCRQGAITKLTLPTLGSVQWTFRKYMIKSSACETFAWANAQPGVATRTLLDASGVSLGASSYTPLQAVQTTITCGETGLPGAVLDEFSNTAITPSKDKIVYYYSTWAGPTASAAGSLKYEYSLPFTRIAHTTSPSYSDRYLSTEIYDCDAAGVCPSIATRSAYVRYEPDDTSNVWCGADDGITPECVDRNRRVNLERTLFRDDADRYADVTYSSFDGLGHYRQAATAGNFGKGDARTTLVNYNGSNGTFPGSFVPIVSTSPWILGTYDYGTATEGTATAKSTFCFEAPTGFLLRQRALKGSSEGANDIVQRFTRDTAGNLTGQESFGGDTQSLGTTSLCSLTLPANQYQVDHTYVYGTRATSQHSTMSFKSLDQDIDLNTGLPKTSRDTTGLATGYTYDSSSRLTWVTPAAGQGGKTQYAYANATSNSALANVSIKNWNNAGTTQLAASEIDFDAFGRAWRSKQLLANGDWSIQDTLYDAMSRKTSVSETQGLAELLAGTSQKKTTFTYDGFGRPIVISPPDSVSGWHDTTISYKGVSETTYTRKVGTSKDVSNNIVESLGTTTETYDRQGRLWKVKEPPGAVTEYTYDIGNRLSKVCSNVVSSVCGQTRLFTYDNRGFLVSEKHPEKGTSGNGTVSYWSYDSGGHAGRRQDGTANGPFDLTFTFDRGERLTQIRETGGGLRLLKELTYATANGTNDWKNGKLVMAKRHNWDRLASDVVVTETYTYGGKDGRVSKRDTSVLNGAATVGAFSESFGYDDLGQMTSLVYPACSTGCSAAAANPARTITNAYTNGFLTSVPSYASSITYHPNGLVNAVAHANGVTDTNANDPYAMRRMASIGTAGAVVSVGGSAANWASGTYTYDGTGNIVKTGGDYYLYDSLNRLVKSTTEGTSTTAGIKVQDYTYDTYANLTSIKTTIGTGTPVTVTPGINAATNRTGESYDEAGNQTSWGGTMGSKYAFDSFRMLSKVNTNQIYYFYTADDERIWIRDDVASRSIFRLRGLGAEVLREWTGSGATGLESWSWGGDYVYRGSLLLSKATPPEALHFSLDHLGTARLVTGASGVKRFGHTYYPFGEESTSTGDTEAIRFEGHEKDSTGLMDMHARYDLPGGGRFLSVDPGRDWNLHKPQSWNMYAYVQNNPANNTDPTGMNIIKDLWGWGVGLFVREKPENDRARQAQQLADDPATGVTQGEAKSQKASTAREGLKEGVTTVGGAVTEVAATAVFFKGVNVAGEAIVTRLGITEHAVERMGERGFTVERIQSTVSTGQSFKYFHEGVWKVGFYDPQSKTFVAAAAGRILTVINNVKPQYIENLKRLTP